MYILQIFGILDFSKIHKHPSFVYNITTIYYSLIKIKLKQLKKKSKENNQHYHDI